MSNIYNVTRGIQLPQSGVEWTIVKTANGESKPYRKSTIQLREEIARRNNAALLTSLKGRTTFVAKAPRVKSREGRCASVMMNISLDGVANT